MNPPQPAAVLADLVQAAPDAVYVSTCGYPSRDLQSVISGPAVFPLVGSMGAALPVGLAVANCRPDRTVVVIDGDGSFLMSLNCLPLVGDRNAHNLVHVILDNGMHESTGGQKTVALDPSRKRFCDLMLSAGYARTAQTEGLTSEARELLNESGPIGLLITVGPRQSVSPRIATEPPDLARRTRELLSAGGHR